MKTAPFFRLFPTDSEVLALASKPVRYPYHDDSDCPVGQEVQRGGQWQYYEPKRIAETRARCPICIELGRPPKT